MRGSMTRSDCRALRQRRYAITAPARTPSMRLDGLSGSCVRAAGRINEDVQRCRPSSRSIP